MKNVRLPFMIFAAGMCLGLAQSAEAGEWVANFEDGNLTSPPFNATAGFSVVTDDDTFGANNNFAKCTASGWAWPNFVTPNTPRRVMTLSFDMYWPDALNETGYIRLFAKSAAGGTISDIGEAKSGPKDIAMGADIPMNQVVHVDYVLNNQEAGTDPISYGRGATIASGKVDVWVDGALVRDELNSNIATTSDIQFMSLALNNGEVWYDNITTRDSAYMLPRPPSVKLMMMR